MAKKKNIKPVPKPKSKPKPTAKKKEHFEPRPVDHPLPILEEPPVDIVDDGTATEPPPDPQGDEQQPSL